MIIHFQPRNLKFEISPLHSAISLFSFTFVPSSSGLCNHMQWNLCPVESSLHVYAYTPIVQQPLQATIISFLPSKVQRKQL